MTTPLSTAGESATRDRARVLVVDDDPSFRNLLVAVLRRNFIVSVASDGEAGFLKALEHPPDIAIIDIQMPGWDGLQTLAAFRKEPSLARVGTIILTADASRGTVLAAVQAGANDYVIKTAFSREEFERKLNRLLQRNVVTMTPAPAKPVARPSATPKSSTLTGNDPASAVAVLQHTADSSETVAAHETISQLEPVSAPSPASAASQADSTPTPPAATTDLQEMLDSWD